MDLQQIFAIPNSWIHSNLLDDHSLAFILHSQPF